MRWWLSALLVLATATPGVAGASSYVEDDLSLSTTKQTETNPQSGSVSDNLIGAWQTTEDLQLGAHLALTHDKATDSGGHFADSGGNILQFGLTGDYDVTKHFSLGASADLSPKSTQYSDAPLSVPANQVLGTGGSQTITVDSLLQTKASSLGGTLSLTYDTSDPDADEPSAFDFSMGLTAGATDYATDQKVTEAVAELPKRTVTLTDADIQRICANNPKRAICRAKLAQSVTQFPLQALASATFYEDTDVGLSFSYYLYSQDPTEVGYFQLARTGRSAGPSFGAGIPLAPQQYAIRPDVDHAFGPVTVDLFGEYGKYVDDQGHETAAGLKAKWRINHAWRLSAGLTFSRDVPGAAVTSSGASSEATTSMLLTGGVRYTF